MTNQIFVVISFVFSFSCFCLLVCVVAKVGGVRLQAVLLYNLQQHNTLQDSGRLHGSLQYCNYKILGVYMGVYSIAITRFWAFTWEFTVLQLQDSGRFRGSLQYCNYKILGVFMGVYSIAITRFWAFTWEFTVLQLQDFGRLHGSLQYCNYKILGVYSIAITRFWAFTWEFTVL